MYEISPYSVPEQILLVYIAHMHEKGLKHSTMLVYPPDRDQIEGSFKALKAVQRGSAPLKRKLALNNCIIPKLGSILSHTFDCSLLWSAFALDYFGAFTCIGILRHKNRPSNPGHFDHRCQYFQSPHIECVFGHL